MSTSNHTCHLHIGAPKTGSTSIQALCAENRDALLKHRILYPEVSLRGYGHHDLAFLLAGGYPEWATSQPRPLEELLSDLSGQAAGHAGDLLLSSENFYLLADPQAVRAGLEQAGALAGRTPHIIVYVRRQDEAHASWYNQTIKAQGYTHGFTDCLAAFSGLFDYKARLAPWAEAFGAQNIDVRVYAAETLPGGDVRLDFLESIGLSSEAVHIPPRRPNVEINLDLLEFQRIFNRLPTSHPEKRRFHRQLMDLSTRAAGLGLFTEGAPLDVHQRRKILADHEAGNAAIARDYLKREQLFAPLDETAVPAQGRGELTMEKLASIIMWLRILEYDL